MSSWAGTLAFVVFFVVPLSLLAIGGFRILIDLITPKPPPKYWPSSMSANPNRTCENCGSGRWCEEWDPDWKHRKSKKWYCPNCLGAD
jgi:hypothetical protein